LRTIAALVVLRDTVITPILAGTAQPKTWSASAKHDATVRKDMQTLFADAGIAA